MVINSSVFEERSIYIWTVEATVQGKWKLHSTASSAKEIRFQGILDATILEELQPPPEYIQFPHLLLGPCFYSKWGFYDPVNAAGVFVSAGPRKPHIRAATKTIPFPIQSTAG